MNLIDESLANAKVSAQQLLHIAKKSTANQHKNHNAEKYIQWVTMLLLLLTKRVAVVAYQICEIPQNFSENSNLQQLKVIDLGVNHRLNFGRRKCLGFPTFTLFDAPPPLGGTH